MRTLLTVLALIGGCAEPLAPVTRRPAFVLGFDSTTTPAPNPNTPSCPPGQMVWWEYDYGPIGELVRVIWFCGPPPTW